MESAWVFLRWTPSFRKILNVLGSAALSGTNLFNSAIMPDPVTGFIAKGG